MEDSFTANQARAKSYEGVDYALSRRMHAIIKNIKAASEVGEFSVTADSLREPVLGNLLQDKLKNMGYSISGTAISW